MHDAYSVTTTPTCESAYHVNRQPVQPKIHFIAS
jgi:hypothetical protein